MSTFSEAPAEPDAFADKGWVGRLSIIVNHGYRACVLRYTRNRSAKCLHALSDRQLRDIGITRGQINDVSRQMARPAIDNDGWV